ncbi:MAG: hypothetical protein JXN61_09575 [Sedimentisphaerales bacterium]|nr:hypothetical protein [Sedimentisphaerales bacterium]
MKTAGIFLAFTLTVTAATQTAFPLKVNENKRYLVDSAGKLFSVMGDTTSGQFKPIEGSPVTNKSLRQFSPPEKNAAGDGDWALVLEAQ